MKYRRVIVRTADMHFGIGLTVESATRRCRRAGGKPFGRGCTPYDNRPVQTVIDEFTSELPFAPHDRKAREDESDAYVDETGSICWIRCERKRVDA